MGVAVGADVGCAVATGVRVAIGVGPIDGGAVGFGFDVGGAALEVPCPLGEIVPTGVGLDIPTDAETVDKGLGLGTASRPAEGVAGAGAFEPPPEQPATIANKKYKAKTGR